MVHYLNRKRQGKVGWSALKLDMAKAYNKMEWGILREVMCRFGFENRWIDLVMLCVTTVHYKVAVNGALTDVFTPTRGLRQGDPLSPYLFIICAEALSYLLTKEVRLGNLTPCVVARGALRISHLFFADDSLLFFKASTQEANVVRRCLLDYCVN